MILMNSTCLGLVNRSKSQRNMCIHFSIGAFAYYVKMCEMVASDGIHFC
jgi:hypothetical protein